MEPALVRLPGRFSVVFNRIGPDVDYHGKRVACLGTLDESLPNIERVSPAVGLTTKRG